MKHKFDKEILKACDIRGVFNENLFKEDFFYIGRAFGTMLKNMDMHTCSIGRDGRISSPILSNSLIQGLLESGINVVNLGLVSTPALYYSQHKLDVDGCCMVSASHNPAKYNGCKFVLRNRVITSDDIMLISKIAEMGTFNTCEEKGSLINYNIKTDYIAHLLKSFDLSILNNSKIIWDGSNGASLFMLNDLISKFPGVHKIICSTIDGTFPCHEPDPSKEINLSMLKNVVKDEKADLGIAFDGDGDRLAVVTGDGKYVTGDQLLVILAKDFLRTNPHSKVMSEVKASIVFYDEIRKNNGIPVMWKVGHTNQQQKLIDEGIGFSGETSGHIFYLENNGEDDGAYAALKLLQIIYEKEKKSLSTLLKEIPAIVTYGEKRLVLDSNDREKLIKFLKLKLNEDDKDFYDLDGVRVNSNNGFWLIRSSNTQPQITTYCESFSEHGYEKVFNEMKNYMKLAGYDYDELSLKKDN